MLNSWWGRWASLPAQAEQMIQRLARKTVLTAALLIGCCSLTSCQSTYNLLSSIIKLPFNLIRSVL